MYSRRSRRVSSKYTMATVRTVVYGPTRRPTTRRTTTHLKKTLWIARSPRSKDGGNHCCNPDGSGNLNIRGACEFLYETIEGGPQDDERWRLMSNVGCFAYTSGTGLFTTGGNGHPLTSPGNQHPCNEIAVVPWFEHCREYTQAQSENCTLFSACPRCTAL